MNILVIGCGKVGSSLAIELGGRGHDVSVVDQNAENFDALQRNFNGFTTNGVPIDQEVLKKAGIENCDALAAVTPDDNVNLMVAQMAKELYKVPKVLVRISDPKRGKVFFQYGLHIICPTSLTVGAMCDVLYEEDEEQILTIGAHTFSFEIINLPRELIGKKPSEIEMNGNEAIYAVERGGTEIILINSEEPELQKGDRLIVSRLVD